jgi:hypothetical protein
MDERELLIQYIKNQHECEWLDFKEKFYVIKYKKECFIKDIVSFANNLNQKDKYIIFGVEDKNHDVCGISQETIPDISTLENLLIEKVEPQITIILGSFFIYDKLIAFIKIPYSNENLPYVIKNECSGIKLGDIYIRKGSINVRATRSDLNDIYVKRGLQQIVPYEDAIIIEPIYMKGSLPENPTYGRVKIEITNFSAHPLLINNAWVEFHNMFGKIERKIYGILPNQNINENPFQVLPNSKFVKTVLFNFLSRDCITLHFDEDGQLITKTYVKTFFEDVNGRIFKSEPKEFYITANGDILHKIKHRYKEFRQYLKRQRKNILKAIELNQDTGLKLLLDVPCIDFSLILPGYVLGNPKFQEYDICAEMIKIANDVRNSYAIKLMHMRGLPQDFVEFTLGNGKKS